MLVLRTRPVCQYFPSPTMTGSSSSPFILDIKGGNATCPSLSPTPNSSLESATFLSDNWQEETSLSGPPMWGSCCVFTELGQVWGSAPRGKHLVGAQSLHLHDLCLVLLVTPVENLSLSIFPAAHRRGKPTSGKTERQTDPQRLFSALHPFVQFQKHCPLHKEKHSWFCCLIGELISSEKYIKRKAALATFYVSR